MKVARTVWTYTKSERIVRNGPSNEELINDALQALELSITNPANNNPTITLPIIDGYSINWEVQADPAPATGTEALVLSGNTVTIARNPGIEDGSGEVTRTITAEIDGFTREFTVTIPAYTNNNNSPNVTVE